MIPVPFDEIDKDAIDGLIDDKVRETKSLEYKLKLHGSKAQDKRDFLADISSFANAGGGDILYGVEEETTTDGEHTGIPKTAHGIPEFNFDGTERRLTQSIRSGIEPKVPGVQMKEILGFQSGPLFLIRVPKSWAGPHRIAYKSTHNFYSRTSAGKHQLDVHEIREAFSLSEEFALRVQNFRDERIGRIVADECPVPMETGPKVILHVVPHSSMYAENQYSMDELRDALEPMRSGRFLGNDFQTNLDGILSTIRGRTNIISYAQFFRAGQIEAVTSQAIRENNGQKIIQGYEEAAIAALKEYLKFYKRLGIDPPFVLILTLVGVRGLSITPRTWGEDIADQIPCFDRHVVPIPEVLIDDISLDPEEMIRPLLDMAWQAGGISRCMLYHRSGVWKGY